MARFGPILPKPGSGGGGGGNFPTLTGSGSPQGVVSGSIGDSYQDTDSGALYLFSDDGNPTDWVLFAGDGDQTISGVAEASNVVFITGPQGVNITDTTADAQGIAILEHGTSSAGILIQSDNNPVNVAGSNAGLSASTGTATVQGEEVSLVATSTGGTVISSGAGPIQTQIGGSLDQSTSALGQLVIGTPLENTTNSDLLVNVVIPVTAATGGHLTIGCDQNTGTPTLVQATPALTGASTITLSVWVPANAFLTIGTSGTITCGTPFTTASPL